jgi:hypothetical protein
MIKLEVREDDVTPGHYTGTYYQTNEVQELRYDRPFHKGRKNKECEFAVSAGTEIGTICSVCECTFLFLSLRSPSGSTKQLSLQFTVFLV